MPAASGLIVATPVGAVAIEAVDGRLTRLTWSDRPSAGGPRGPDGRLLERACSQIREYFGGQRRVFGLPLAPAGTPFQQRVWALLLDVAYGRTRTYGHIAADLGTSPRAVARACGANPLPLLVPCHRIVAAGSDGGYSAPGGLATKRFLLALEAGQTTLSGLAPASTPSSFPADTIAERGERDDGCGARPRGRWARGPAFRGDRGRSPGAG